MQIISGFYNLKGYYNSKDQGKKRTRLPLFERDLPEFRRFDKTTHH